MKGQADINCSVNDFWVDAAYPFERYVAALTSAAGAVRGWGWSNREPVHARRGLGSIFRCLMSRYLANAGGKVKLAADTLYTELGAPPTLFFDLHTYRFAEMATHAKIDLLGAVALAGRTYPALFAAIMADCSITWADLKTYYASEETLQRDYALFNEVVPRKRRRLISA
ncbi:hypothetical protein R70006_06273 [Paraburkholderia domus]|uniref:hypothetical protein n=1 Tax=Paraburkholderia domus TaxID=2793075 RepID=UPI001913DA71|nr:hypothetical protein [Paraburkholderia domus]MBK5052904.1 hypothetical protein [Burkholderia sp. R-70006]CAE6822552.1 hypothetical protein R70006_06273 [Paraburkholderia domus]